MGHEEQALSDVVSPRARSAEINRPDGVALSFHVSVNKVEPSKSVRGRNLLTKDKDISRLACLDEVEPVGPKVPLISEPAAPACRGERLAGAATCPHRPLVRPAGFSQGVAPDADAGEHVDLGVRLKFLGRHISNVSLVNDAWSDSASGNQVTQPLGREWVDLVVIGRHRSRRSSTEAQWTQKKLREATFSRSRPMSPPHSMQSTTSNVPSARAIC